MSRISERLEVYQTQMSIYAEQHRLILASDVLDMIEQLQDDLNDAVNDIVEKLEEDNTCRYRLEGYIPKRKAIEIVKAGGTDE